MCPLTANSGQGRYRLEQPLAVAEVEPKLLQIGVGEVPQDIAADAVLGERRSVMSEPLLSEPTCDIEHSAIGRVPGWNNSTTGPLRSYTGKPRKARVRRLGSARKEASSSPLYAVRWGAHRRQAKY